ncbi:unnamed protein product [Medioppia subpectinata]|uniref:Uncharacterized protein n=1 Tax=Medioppia subpectinata TaxID=1979941 RepID=A0A7R9L586_9ACAR|nr:unnamed protein product [Medioppia subpectinata]CAG2115563.1 unnamed protein product [Medioppia subpectinata]
MQTRLIKNYSLQRLNASENVVQIKTCERLHIYYINSLKLFNECTVSPDVRSVCEKCAKVTKSDMAYPLCCSQRSDREWCQLFLDYTLSQK